MQKEIKDEYWGLNEQIKRFEPMTEKERYLFRIAWKLAVDTKSTRIDVDSEVEEFPPLDIIEYWSRDFDGQREYLKEKLAGKSDINLFYEVARDKPQMVHKRFGEIVGYNYNHIREVNGSEKLEGIDRDHPDSFISIRTIKEYERNNRYWTWNTIWYRNIPLMIVVNAGRSMGDSFHRFITDVDSYQGLILESHNGMECDVSIDMENTTIIKDMDDKKMFSVIEKLYGEDIYTCDWQF